MDMRIGLVEMHIETHDIILPELSCHEIVDVRCPFLYVLGSFQMGVVCTFFKVHSLVVKGYLQHPFPAASKYHLSEDALFPAYIVSGVRILDFTASEDVVHLFIDGLGLVNGLNLTTFGDLKVQMGAGRVVVGQTILGFFDP